MSTTLTFCYADCALSVARSLAATGRFSDALARLEPAMGAVRPEHAADARRFAAELSRELERYGQARRHLREAIAHRPGDAGLHYELGLAFQDDPYGCDRRAAACFRKAVSLEPNHPTFRAALGLALVRLNRLRAGLRHLKRAAHAALTDPAVMGVVLTGLREADRPQTAVKWLAVALFRAPGNLPLQRLMDRARFDVVRADQDRSSRVGRRPVGSPATLPFVRIATETTGQTTGGGIVRTDLGSRPAPHLGRLAAFRTGG